MKRIGVLGARGYVGAELLAMIAKHPSLRVAFASSRGNAGKPVEHAPGVVFEDIGPDDAARRDVDAWVLALPNGESPRYVEAFDRAGRDVVLVDLGADYRFDDAWTYGLVERNRARIAGSRRISNPGCYATGMQLAIAPFLEVLAGPPVVFGVSGYSGAGTTPSPKNDPEALRDNLMPYALTGHVHEREASRHLGMPVRFTPHVAPFFRGITLTISLSLRAPLSSDELFARARAAYQNETLVRVQKEIPLVRDIAGKDDVVIGGFEAFTPRPLAARGERADDDTGRAVVIATIDNLRKGAATQALQNLNLALGFPELEGIAV